MYRRMGTQLTLSSRQQSLPFYRQHAIYAADRLQHGQLRASYDITYADAMPIRASRRTARQRAEFAIILFLDTDECR